MGSRLAHMVGIIGYGHMGQAIGKRLLKKGFRVLASDGEKNIEIARKSNAVIIAVKPFAVAQVLQEIAGSLRKNQLLISIAAGVSLQTIMKSLREGLAPKQPKQQKRLLPQIIRVMPNLPAQIGLGMSVWKSAAKPAAPKAATRAKSAMPPPPLRPSQKKLVKSILKTLGEEIEVKAENLIDAATALSGSGPAYVFAFLNALSKTANKLGFSQKDGQLLAIQTVLGSTKYAALITMAPSIRRGAVSFADLVSQIKTKGGTTEAAFKILEKRKWQKILEASIQNAYKKSLSLGRK